MAQFSNSDYQAILAPVVEALQTDDIVGRIWAKDHTVWADDPTEITNRLDWLDNAQSMQGELAAIQSVVDAVRAEGYTDVLLLGMGGSSLAPEVFSRTFGAADSYLRLQVLDSTDPDMVLQYHQELDLSKTVFIVATKSGGTVETLSGFKYFYNALSQEIGEADAGAHFIAITDPGSKLVTLAEQYNFRATFLNNPNIGGRYSVISHFGLVPAALLGVDVARLLDQVLAMADACQNPTIADNPGAYVGAVMGALAKHARRDKLTFIASAPIISFGDWVEQLIAESTGKFGKGILPVVNEPPMDATAYGQDRLFVYLRLDTEHDAFVEALEAAHQPVIRIDLADVYDLGKQFFLWEFATAIAGHVLGIQPFDQPNVESAKVSAREMVDAYHKTGSLPRTDPAATINGIEIYGQDVAGDTLADVMAHFLGKASEGAYVALQAYIHPTQASDSLLQALRAALLKKTGYATTLGYGPRFLHSTGQLHKGDAGHGLFIQITADSQQDVAIPDEAGKPDSAMSFQVLKMSQALGDRQALLNAEPPRTVIRFHFAADAIDKIATLTNAL